MSMAEVGPPIPVEDVPSPAPRRGTIGLAAGPTAIVAGGSLPFPRGFPRVNPLTPDIFPLLFSREADR